MTRKHIPRDNSPMAGNTKKPARPVEEVRTELNADVEAFLANGGAIETCDPGARTENAFGYNIKVGRGKLYHRASWKRGANKKPG